MNLINFNNLNSYQILAIICAVITFILCLINFNRTYLRKSDSRFEFFTDIIQQEAYVCKTNNNIFDKHYMDLYDIIYHDYEVDDYLFDKLSETIYENKNKNKNKNKNNNKNKNKNNNKNKNKNKNKNINFLVIWPSDVHFIKQFNKYHYSSELLSDNITINKKVATQNEYLITHFKNVCKCDANNHNLLSLFTFELQSFTHIILNNFNIYKFTFKDQLKLLNNVEQWCKNEGYFIIYLLNEKIFESDDKNPLLNLTNSTHRSSGNIQFKKFNINTTFRYGDKTSKYKNISVKEELEINYDNEDDEVSKKRRVYEYCLNITPMEILVNKIVSLNFDIIEKYPLSAVDPYYSEHYLYIFKKNNTTSSYNEF